LEVGPASDDKRPYRAGSSSMLAFAATVAGPPRPGELCARRATLDDAPRDGTRRRDREDVWSGGRGRLEARPPRATDRRL